MNNDSFITYKDIEAVECIRKIKMETSFIFLIKIFSLISIDDLVLL